MYDGDLSSPEKLDNIKQMDVSAGAFIRYSIIKGLAIRSGVVMAKIQGNDYVSDLDWQKERDLTFESKIFELNALVEVHPLQLINPNRGLLVSPYVFGGVSYFKFNPQAKYNDEMVDLQPLGTEGQGTVGYENPYNLNAMAVPFGLGLRFFFGSFILDLEYGARNTSTDYLDDTSSSYVEYGELLEKNGLAAAELGNKIRANGGATRGNPDVKDWYAISSVSVAYRFDPGKILGGLKGNNMKCPTF